MTKKQILSLVIYIICFILMWNLLDFLFNTFVTGKGYTFALSTDMLAPLTLMVLIQIVQMRREKKRED